MIDALRYLRRHKVIHRNMKLGNLFLNKNMEIKVGDLGLSAKLATAEERKKTICGTPNYIAPEIIAGHSHSFEFDVWSLGVIMFTMLCGKPPFETKDVKSTYKKIQIMRIFVSIPRYRFSRCEIFDKFNFATECR